MRFSFCPDCGTKAVLKVIGDEGEMPYCMMCERPLFDLFPVCVLCAVRNARGQIALIRQSYVNAAAFVGVAGYMRSGESAEAAAAREVTEELGLAVSAVRFVRSYPYVKKDMLMLGFAVTVEQGDFNISGEVDKAAWFSYDEAVAAVREGSIIQQLLIDSEQQKEKP